MKLPIDQQIKLIENELLNNNTNDLKRYIELVNTRIRNLENKCKSIS